MVKKAIGRSRPTHQTYRIDIQDKRGFATALIGLGIENDSVSEGEFDFVEPAGCFISRKPRSVAG